MADITIVNGVYKPTYNWGAPSCSNHNSFHNDNWLVVQFHHLEKYEFVNWKDDIPYMKWKIKLMFETTNQINCVYPNIVPAIVLSITKSYSRKWIQTLPEKILYHLNQIPIIIPMEVQLCP